MKNGMWSGVGALVAVVLAAGCADAPAPVVPESNLRMARRLAARVESLDPRENRYRNEQRIEMLRNAPLPPGSPQAIQARGELVEELVKAGRTEEAREELAEISVALDAMEPGVPPQIRDIFEEFNAFIHLRLGQEANCVGPQGSKRCLFPTPPDGLFPDTVKTREALELFRARLEDVPGNLNARYYFNVAAMRLGLYPDSVPEAWRIPPESLGWAEDVPRFVDRAAELGVDTWSRAGGSVMDDFDGDGDLDLMASSSGPSDPLRFFRNEEGRFVDRTVEAGLEGLVGGLNLVQADYDNDGFLDVFVLRAGWSALGFPSSLLRNLGDGRFQDVSEAAGVGGDHSTQTAAWGDFDRDGWLDLLVGHETHTERDPAALYRNNRDGTFTDVAARVGLDVLGFSKSVMWGDIDNDGLLDVFFSRIREPNQLFRNLGPDESGEWRFEPVDSGAGVEDFIWSFPGWFWDYDNDGWLDLFLSGWGVGPDDLWREHRGLEHEGIRARLYRNDGDGTFTEVSEEAGVSLALNTMGSNYGDIDNDGFPDFYVGTGEPDFRALMPSRMFRNVKGARFEEVTASAAAGYLYKGHGVAFGDIDHDGDQDAYVVFGGAHPGDLSPNVLMENPGNGHAWVTLRLEGTTSNRSAIGARVAVRTDGPDGPRTVRALAGAGGSFGGSSLQQEIGLGTADRIVDVEVGWPAGGVELFKGITPRGFYRLVEGSGRALPLDVPLQPLGG